MLEGKQERRLLLLFYFYSFLIIVLLLFSLKSVDSLDLLCDSPIAPCGNICPLRGICVNNTNNTNNTNSSKYYCSCLAGRTGDECTESTCLGNSGTCIQGDCNIIDSENCTCYLGWSGVDCDVFTGIPPHYHPSCTVDGDCEVNSYQGNSNDDYNSSTTVDTYGPDLIPFTAFTLPFIEFKQFNECDCLVRQNYTSGIGRRKLLRFTMETLNQGNSDLFLGNPWQSSPSANFFFHPCFRQPQFFAFSEVSLTHLSYNQTFQNSFFSSTVVDSRPAPSYVNDSGVQLQSKYKETQQGLQVGWIDSNPRSSDLNWFDVTSLPLGDYELKINVNPNRDIFELDYDNNLARVLVNCDKIGGCGVYGKCDFGTKCVCDSGYTGDKCDVQLSSPPPSLSFSSSILLPTPQSLSSSITSEPSPSEASLSSSIILSISPSLSNSPSSSLSISFSSSSIPSLSSSLSTSFSSSSIPSLSSSLSTSFSSSSIPSPSLSSSFSPSISSLASISSLPSITPSPSNMPTPSPSFICLPDCKNRYCGDDSCAGSCGTCPSDHSCLNNWQCVGSNIDLDRVKFSMSYIILSEFKRSLIIINEEQESKRWINIIAVMLEVPEGSIELESFKIEHQKVQVIFYFWEVSKKTAEEIGDQFIQKVVTEDLGQTDDFSKSGMGDVMVKRLVDDNWNKSKTSVRKFWKVVGWVLVILVALVFVSIITVVVYKKLMKKKREKAAYKGLNEDFWDDDVEVDDL